MMQSAPVNVGPDNAVIVDKLDGHAVQVLVPSSGTIDEKKESPSATDEQEHTEYNSIPTYLQDQQHLQQQQQHAQHYHNPYAQHQYAPHVIGGMVPPQQVYVQQQQQQQQHQHQLPLESQFQSLGLGDNTHAGAGGAVNGGNSHESNNSSDDPNNSSSNESNNNDRDETNNNTGERKIVGEEGDENECGEEEPIKLFVGQVREYKER